jgi:DNA polymerase-3 subunit alpha
MVKASDFVHLHVHSDFSLLDGACTVKGLVKKAAQYGHTALALTDHGNLCGALAFYKAAKSAGIKPIVGCEIYVAPGKLSEREKGYNHLTLLAKNEAGYRNISKLSSLGFRDGFYYKPRVDMELLSRYNEGVIALSGCLKGPISVPIVQGKAKEARAATQLLHDIYGRDFYLEIQPNDFEEQHLVNDACIKLSREMGLPLAVTCDVHYLEPEDGEVQDIKICIGSGKVLSARNRLKINSDLYYRPTAEIARLFSHVPEAILNTRGIAEKVDFKFPTGTYYLPRFQPPGGLSPEEFFERSVHQGMIKRYGELQPHHVERMRMEVEVIKNSGYIAYFLIVADFIQWARDNGIPVGPGRGSAAGSIVAYSMGITDVDPLQFDLLFERFLNPDRVSMPDIDIDFCEANRGRVIEYVRQKYGEECVTQIVTFGTLKAKAVVRDVGRVMEVPLRDVNQLAKLIPEGPKVNLESAFRDEPKLGEARKSNATYNELFRYAERLEGLNRHAGKHAAGVVISDVDLLERIPLYKVGNDLTTQYTMAEVEEVGLLKMDFLGLRTLTVIAHAERLISQKIGKEFSVGKIPFDDKLTFELMSRGETRGVFQLESSGFRELIARVKPDRFEDIIALIALYRPGPLGSGMDNLYVSRKHGEEPVTFLHESLRPILEETYGAILYQEQVMRIANVVAGFTMGQADTLRKAMGKKKLDLMEQYKPSFIEGCKKVSGIAEEVSAQLWDQIAFFAEYGFNKCVVAETEIIEARSGERTTIGELNAAPRPFAIHALDENGKLAIREVVDVFPNGEKPVFELTTAQGRRITATGNHPFRVMDGWKKLEELSPGDRIAAPRHLKIETKESWPEHELITLAGLLSEGNTCHPSCLYFYNNDRALVDDFIAAVESFDFSSARLTTRPDGRFDVCVSTGRNTRYNSQSIPWNSSKRSATQASAVCEAPTRSGAFLWAGELGLLGKRAHEKSIPEGLFSTCDSNIELFLGRLWSGDGFIANAEQATPYYASSSPRLAGDVQTLLLRLGIISGVHQKQFKYRGGHRTGYTVHLVGEGSRETFVERVAPHIVGRDAAVEHLRTWLAQHESDKSSKDTVPSEVRNWVREERARLGLSWNQVQEGAGVCFKEFIGKGNSSKQGFRRSTIARIGRFFASKRLEDLGRSDVFWDRIVRIEAKGVQPTFDLTVERDHNFVANGLIVHNSHSAAYGFITYQTGFLKAHYPAEYMAALMTSFRSAVEKMVEYIEESRRMGIPILAPDVNEGDWAFSVKDEKIVYGLEAIRGVGHGAIEAIVEARNKDGKFRSIYDFCERVDISRCSKGVIEHLIKGGAFDSLGGHRAQLCEAIEDAVSMGVKTQREKNSNQIGLFGAVMSAASARDDMDAKLLPDTKPWTASELLAHEKNSLGFYLSSHPLDEDRDIIERYSTHNTVSLAEAKDGEEVVVGGMIQTLRTTLDRKGNRMAFLTIEDRHGVCEGILFASIYADVSALITEGARLFIKGKAEMKRDTPQIMVKDVLTLDKASDAFRVRVHFEMKMHEMTEAKIDAVRAVLHEFPGPDSVQYSFVDENGEKIGPFIIASHLHVKASARFEEALRGVIGEDARIVVKACLDR